MVTLKEWKVSVREAMAATGRSFHKAAISADLSSAFKSTDSAGRPRASAATLAALAAAAAAAAVVLLASRRAANWASVAAVTVFVFIRNDSFLTTGGFPPGRESVASATDRETMGNRAFVVKSQLKRKGPGFPPGLFHSSASVAATRTSKATSKATAIMLP